MEMFLWAVAMMILSSIINMLIAPRPQQQTAQPANIADFKFPQFEEGTPQVVVFGDAWIEEWMVLWYGNYRKQPIKRSSGK